MLRLAADENFNHNIVRGLLRRKPNLDIVCIQDVGLSEADDPAILEWAANENRVLLTHDVSTMTYYAYERIQAGLHRGRGAQPPHLTSAPSPERRAPRCGEAGRAQCGAPPSRSCHGDRGNLGPPPANPPKPHGDPSDAPSPCLRYGPCSWTRPSEGRSSVQGWVSAKGGGHGACEGGGDLRVGAAGRGPVGGGCGPRARAASGAGDPGASAEGC